jgi:hypothetical protein
LRARQLGFFDETLQKEKNRKEIDLVPRARRDKKKKEGGEGEGDLNRGLIRGRDNDVGASTQKAVVNGGNVPGQLVVQEKGSRPEVRGENMALEKEGTEKTRRAK